MTFISTYDLISYPVSVILAITVALPVFRPFTTLISELKLFYSIFVLKDVVFKSESYLN
jgi:hypothetical protein